MLSADHLNILSVEGRFGPLLQFSTTVDSTSLHPEFLLLLNKALAQEARRRTSLRTTSQAKSCYRFCRQGTHVFVALQKHTGTIFICQRFTCSPYWVWSMGTWITVVINIHIDQDTILKCVVHPCHTTQLRSILYKLHYFLPLACKKQVHKGVHNF